MVLEKYLVSNNKLLLVVQFTLLLSLSVTAPLLHNQIITGSIVNAILFISVATIGLTGASLICLVPSIFALLTGTLPAVLAPFIPFIILSNIILVLSFNYLKKYNYWLGVISASLLKFLFLFSVSFFISNSLAVMFSWPQLLTSLLGGLIAYFVLKFNKVSYGK